MRLIGLLLLLAAAMPAVAEFAVVEETATTTVYREGNQIIVLVDGGKRGDWRKVAEARSPERAVQSSFRSQISGKDMFYFYLVRTRLLDGEPICEKFFQRYPEEERRKQMVQILSLAPCGQNF